MKSLSFLLLVAVCQGQEMNQKVPVMKEFRSQAVGGWIEEVGGRSQEIGGQSQEVGAMSHKEETTTERDALSSAVSELLKALEGAVEVLEDALRPFMVAAAKLVEGLVDGVGRVMEVVLDVVKAVLGPVLEVVSDSLIMIAETLMKVFTWLYHSWPATMLRMVVVEVIKKMLVVLERTILLVEDVFNLLVKIGKKVFNSGLVQNLVSTLSDLVVLVVDHIIRPIVLPSLRFLLDVTQIVLGLFWNPFKFVLKQALILTWYVIRFTFILINDVLLPLAASPVLLASQVTQSSVSLLHPESQAMKLLENVIVDDLGLPEPVFQTVKHILQIFLGKFVSVSNFYS